MKTKRRGRPVLRRVFGILLILIGVGAFAVYHVMEYLYPPEDTDVASILDRQIPSSTKVRVTGVLSESDWTVTETEEETGKFLGIRRVYRLTDDSGGETLSILVVSDRSRTMGEPATVEGTLLRGAYSLPGYVIDLPDEPPIPLAWMCAGTMIVCVLLGIVFLVTGR
jgi:hypothetical protein